MQIEDKWRSTDSRFATRSACKQLNRVEEIRSALHKVLGLCSTSQEIQEELKSPNPKGDQAL